MLQLRARCRLPRRPPQRHNRRDQRPVPTTAAGTTETRPLPAGRVAVPVGPGVSFELREPLDAIHLPGISALYPSAARTSEVDIFVPVATADGRSLVTFEDVVDYIETDPVFASLVSLGPTDWNGISSVGFFGYGGQLQLGFTTDPRRVGDVTAGWFLAAEVELWVLDTTAGPIIVTGESLAEASDSEALETLDLMVAVLSSLEISG